MSYRKGIGSSLNHVEPDTTQDIIGCHINDLPNDINKCDLNDAVEQMVEDIDPELQ
jgi:hypothetical protein